MDQHESGPATTQPLLSQRPSIEGGQPILESGTWIRLAPPEAQRDDWLARRFGWSRQMRLWVNLIFLSLVLSAVYVGVLVGVEKWTFVQSVFYAASIGYSVGMVPENAAGEDLNLEDDVAILCTCVYAFASMGCLACVGALLVQLRGGEALQVVGQAGGLRSAHGLRQLCQQRRRGGSQRLRGEYC